MKRDRLRLYLLEISLLIILFLALFVSNIFDKRILALFIALIAFITKLLIKKKKPLSFYSYQVTWLMVGFGVIYLIVFYMMGIYFGYYKSPTPFGFKTIINFILPFTVIVVSSEVIRKTLIVQRGKLSKILLTISMVLIDLVIYWGVYNVRNLNDMLTIVGFILFASVACNLLYNYITYFLINIIPPAIVINTVNPNAKYTLASPVEIDNNTGASSISSSPGTLLSGVESIS